MKYVDFSTSAWLAVVIAGFYILKSSLGDAMDKMLAGNAKCAEEARESLAAIVNMQVAATFFQMIFMSL